MATSIERQAGLVLKALGDFRESSEYGNAGRCALTGEELTEATQLAPDDLNDVVKLLERAGHAKAEHYMGTTPYNFGCVGLTPSGRLEYQRMLGAAAKGSEVQKNPKNVFVVHGRNTGARDAIFDFLRSIDLIPMEWEEARRLTGKVSPYIGEILDAAFNHAQAILVLFTGDDEARLREQYRSDPEPSHETNLTPQARPNVLFEAGMALGRHPDRTLLIEIGELRPFSDIAGRHTVRISKGGPGERQIIVDRLRGAGCAVATEGRRDWLERDYFGAVFAADPR